MDPHDEIKSKFSGLDSIRKQALDQIHQQSNTEKMYDDSIYVVETNAHYPKKNSGSLNNSIQQDKSPITRTKKDNFGEVNTSLNKDSGLPKEKTERESTRKLLVAGTPEISMASTTTQRKPPLMDTSADPNLNVNVVRSSIERLEQKTESHINKIERFAETFS